MRYDRLNIRFYYPFSWIDKTMERYFCVIDINGRLFCNNLINNVFACEVNAKSVVRDA